MSRNTLAFAVAIFVALGAGAGWLILRSNLDDRGPNLNELDPKHPPQSLLHSSECRSNSDCPARHICRRDPITEERRCLPSECETDSHCPTGYGCRYAGADARGTIVRRCLLAGRQKEGESCVSDSESKHEACSEGLVCHLGFCGRRCRFEDPSSCPEGFSCQHNENGDSCLPDCAHAQCSEGQRCFTLDEHYPLCGIPVPGGCMDAPCPPGQECRTSIRPDRKEISIARTCISAP